MRLKDFLPGTLLFVEDKDLVMKGKEMGLEFRKFLFLRVTDLGILQANILIHFFGENYFFIALL